MSTAKGALALAIVISVTVTINYSHVFGPISYPPAVLDQKQPEA